MKKQTKKNFLILLFICIVSVTYTLRKLYEKDADKSEPLIWQGALQYRLNFRDVGESLNQCLGQKKFATNLMFRSNKNFSGWSCEKIKNPSKIYSFNFNPDNPQSFYCMTQDQQKQFGIKFNDTLGIHDITDLKLWKEPDYKNALCKYFKHALIDLTEQNSFLFHCDVGRDRTGDFAAMLTYMLLEDKKINTSEMQKALECDYEKTPAITQNHKGHIQDFLLYMDKYPGGIKGFIQSNCSISDDTIRKASNSFILD